MDVKYWPVVAPKEENALPFPVKKILSGSIADYLKTERKYTLRGIALYLKPTIEYEVGFLIRRRAGNAVARNRTRRLFSGLMLNGFPELIKPQGYLFLFHRSFRTTAEMLPVVDRLVKRALIDD